MTEEILLLPGANGTELIRMLARFRKNSIGLRIMNGAEFARFALMRSGIVLTENFLPRKQESAVIDGFVRDIDYFASASYADAEKIADALNLLRGLIPENEAEKIHENLPLGVFSDKNNALMQVYDRYRQELKIAGNIDTIGLIRKALAEAEPLSCSVCTLKEYPLTPLEDALVNHLAKNRVDKTLCQQLEVAPAELCNIDYVKSYGCSNEVEAIYDYIVANNLPFDECTVAVANPTPYAQLFFDFAQRRNLPICLGCGLPILNSNPARMLKLLFSWNHTGYNGVDALRTLIYSDSFNQKELLATLGITRVRQLDEIIEIAGQLRLNFDLAENHRKIAAFPRKKGDDQVYAGLKILADELALGESKLIKKYALIRSADDKSDCNGVARLDRSALSVICGTLDAYEKYSKGRPLDLIIPQLLQRSVRSENSQPGALFVTGISGAMASMRKHLFVAGMSASNFPGSPRENYLLLDCDFLDFADENTAPTSTNRVAKKRKALEDLLSLAAALNVSTHISYSCYDLANMKAENPSSMLFDIFRKQEGEGATLEEYQKAFRNLGYFDQQVSGDYTVGKAYVQKKNVLSHPAENTEKACAYTKDRAYSPSALSDFFSCPRKFFLLRILGVKPEETDDPFTVLDALEIGNLAHELMKGLFDAPCDKNTFLQRSDDIFDRAMLSRPPLLQPAAAVEKRKFRKMMENAYEQNPKCDVLTSEEELTYRHSSGILLHGFPDRVEEIAKGRYVIVDYKTGKKVKHEEDDINTCLQVVVYAYLLEADGKTVDHCEYRYPRDKITVKCKYDGDMKAQLNEKLQEFGNALKTGQFPCTTEESACEYCTLAGICGKSL